VNKMAFTRPPIDTIYKRMKADLEERLNNNNWFSRSMMLVLLAVFAGAIYLCYGFLINVSKQFFFTKALPEFLDWHSRLYGLPRKAATYSTKNIRITGVDDKVIEEGTQFKANIINAETPNGILFETTEEVIIDGGIADVVIISVESGTSSNCEVETLSLVTPLDDVDSEATVIEDLETASDQETDEELIVRLLQRTQNPPGSGNVTDYERWALEVEGVGRAWGKAAEDWYGVGTCGIIIATTSLEPVSSTVLEDAIEYIDSKRPVGADVDVKNIQNKNAYFYISISPYNSDNITACNDSLTELFMVESEPGGTILLSHIEKAIINTGINDFEITAITLNGDSIPVDDIVTTGINTLRFSGAEYVELV